MSLGIVFKLLGSLALLIYGMKMMSEALQKMAGAHLRHILERMMTNRFTGMLTGTFLTCAVQSSSATTVMTVSFVSAGLLTLSQAISVIMGANIGTTLTAWIISLGYNVDLTFVVFPAFLIGMVLIYKKQHRFMGDFLFGMAFLFWSLLMLSAVGKDMDLEHNADVVAFFSSFDTESHLTILAFLAIGTVITCIVQSSAAVMAITILLCSTGVMPIYVGIALVMGENIGTTATANLAALGAGITARRAAIAHLLFNVFGVFWVLVIFYPFVDIICELAGYDPMTSGQTERLPIVLALFHTCFNVLNTALLISFIPYLERLVCWMIPDDKVSKKSVSTLQYINHGLMTTPEISVLQAQKEIILFAERMQRMFGMVRSFLDEKDKKEFERQYKRIVKYEQIADNMEFEIATYLGNISNEHLSDDTKQKIQSMFRLIGELESIGDACLKTARSIHRLHEGSEDFTSQQYNNLHDMLLLVNEALTHMMVVVSGRRKGQTIDFSMEIEKEINTMCDQLRQASINDVDEHNYSYSLCVLYNDIIVDCEKLADYVMNVVEACLGKKILKYKGLQMNIDKKTVTVDGVAVNLTRTEFELLHQLLAKRGQVLSRQQLMANVWTGVIISDRTINVHITRLRKKLGPYAHCVVSRQGFGYLFD